MPGIGLRDDEIVPQRVVANLDARRIGGPLAGEAAIAEHVEPVVPVCRQIDLKADSGATIPLTRQCSGTPLAAEIVTVAEMVTSGAPAPVASA